MAGSTDGPAIKGDLGVMHLLYHVHIIILANESVMTTRPSELESKGGKPRRVDKTAGRTSVRVA